MIIKKGTKVTVEHNRKGTFNAIAAKKFDTKKDDWYPLVVDQEFVEGKANEWVEGEELPCRASLCDITIRK